VSISPRKPQVVGVERVSYIALLLPTKVTTGLTEQQPRRRRQVSCYQIVFDADQRF
jgi:hypothetical protein